MCGAGNGSVLVLYLRCRCIGLRLGLRLPYMQKSTRASGGQHMHSQEETLGTGLCSSQITCPRNSRLFRRALSPYTHVPHACMRHPHRN